jgi:hypothetical protein
LVDVLKAAMTSRNLLEATMTSDNLVNAILNLVDMVEVILSPTNPEKAVSNLYGCYPELSLSSESHN